MNDPEQIIKNIVDIASGKGVFQSNEPVPIDDATGSEMIGLLKSYEHEVERAGTIEVTEEQDEER